jgi:two-component system CheB/CheR fusion protein
VERQVLERHAPAHVVVNSDGDILHFSTHTGKYLEPPPGLPSRELIGMARRGLRIDLRAAMREAAQTRRAISRRNIAVEIDDRVQIVNLMVEPFGDELDPLYLVLFNDVGEPFNPSDEQARRDRQNSEQSKDIDRLESEVRDARESLQRDSEEYEAAAEEQKSANEELQSLNEELQSTNEELETSKEELQSVNEELQTINSELNTKIEEVDHANIILRNVFDTMFATIFLDQKLVIRNFTPAATKIFNLIPTDKGRPLADIVTPLDNDKDLQRDIKSVIEHGEGIERRIQRADGKSHYLLRILPYRGRNGIVDGTLVTFVDVTKIVEAGAHQPVLADQRN